MYDIMIDIETLGLEQNAKVMQIAAVAFDPWAKVGDKVEKLFSSYVNFEDGQEDRTISGNTICWWINNHPRLLQDHIDQAVEALEADLVLQDLNAWALSGPDQMRAFTPGHSRVWANGILFDLGILDNLANDQGVTPFWRGDYRCPRDMRNLRDIVKWTNPDAHNKLHEAVSEIDFGGAQAHDALYDCMYQLNIVRGYYDILGVRSKPEEL